MWITEIREKETDHVLARVEHGTSCTRLPKWPRMFSGTSAGFWVMKNTPTPLDLIRVYMVRFSATHSVHLFWEEE